MKTKLEYKVEVYLKEPTILKLGDTFDPVEIINQECTSKDEAMTFINQGKEEPLAYKIVLFKYEAHWWDKEFLYRKV